MNRLEGVRETRRATLNRLATGVPTWRKAHAPSEWEARDEARVETFRAPKETNTQEALADQVGRDGWSLRQWIGEEKAMPWLREIPAVEIWRRAFRPAVWDARRADPRALP